MPSNERSETVTVVARQAAPVAPVVDRGVLRAWAVAAAVLTLAFGQALYDLAIFSSSNSLFSHIVLIPLVSGYLVWLDRDRLPAKPVRDPAIAAGFAAAGAIALAAYWLAEPAGFNLAHETSLALAMVAYVLFLVATTGYFFSRATLRILAFPLGFLLFMAPFPPSWVSGIETFLQHGSADAAAVMFRAVGTPLLRNELIFQLPGMTLEVAPECSGIRSSLALFITSLVAGHLLLRSPWSRVILAFAVIPLALIRNGFRIFTIGELCVHISPDMIHSFIHRQGGPVFFALSLIPFGLLLFYLTKRERRAKPAGAVSQS